MEAHSAFTADWIRSKVHRYELTRGGFKPAGDDGTFFQHIALRRNVG